MRVQHSLTVRIRITTSIGYNRAPRQMLSKKGGYPTDYQQDIVLKGEFATSGPPHFNALAGRAQGWLI